MENETRKTISMKAYTQKCLVQLAILPPFTHILKKTLTIIIILILTISSSIGQTNFYNQLADSALVLTNQSVVYDPEYRVIDYPNGDVPADKGVCTDVVIRAFRKL